MAALKYIRFGKHIGDIQQNIPDWDNAICQFCQMPTSKGVVTHIIPAIRNGETAGFNLVYACSKCAHAKHTRTPKEWRAHIATLPEGHRHYQYVDPLIGKVARINAVGIEGVITKHNSDAHQVMIVSWEHDGWRCDLEDITVIDDIDAVVSISPYVPTGAPPRKAWNRFEDQLDFPTFTQQYQDAKCDGPSCSMTVPFVRDILQFFPKGWFGVFLASGGSAQFCSLSCLANYVRDAIQAEGATQ